MTNKKLKLKLHCKSVSVLISLMLFAVATSAADKNGSMSFSADRVNYNYVTGVGTYHGNIAFDKSDTHIRGDDAKTYTNDHHKLVKAIITGHPASIHIEPTTQKVAVKAYADEINYDPIAKKIILRGHAVVDYGKDHFHGPQLEYRIKQQIVLASATHDSKPQLLIEARD